MDTNNISSEFITNSLHVLTDKYVWLYIIGVLTLIFRTSIEKFVAAIFMFFGNDLNEDDIVYIDGRPGRIIRIGLTKTIFFIYDIVDGKIVGGNKLVVQNEKLADLNIEKPLQNLNLHRFSQTHKSESIDHGHV